MIHSDDGKEHWFVMRDLGRKHVDPADGVRKSAWEIARDSGLRVFVALAQREIVRGGHKRVELLPVVRDLVFIRALYEDALRITRRQIGLTFRFVKGGDYQDPMTVPDKEMDAFVKACESAGRRDYYSTEQLTELSLGRRVRVVNGPLAGLEGNLLKVKGARRKRIVLGIDGVLYGSFEISDAPATPTTWYEFLD